VQVEPKFHEDASNLEELVPFEECIELHSSEKAVLRAPDYLLLTHNGRSFKSVSIFHLSFFLSIHIYVKFISFISQYFLMELMPQNQLLRACRLSSMWLEVCYSFCGLKYVTALRFLQCRRCVDVSGVPVIPFFFFFWLGMVLLPLAAVSTPWEAKFLEASQ
jgi:hypothetical protein